MPKVSVIIPSFNHAKYINQAIESVLGQTFHDFEIIVVDDGSTDHTRSVIEKIRDPRIFYIYQPNSGLSSARNTGLKVSKGDYIALLDADDLFLPNKLEVQTIQLDNNRSLDLVAGGWLLINEKGETIGDPPWWIGKSKLDIKTFLFSCPIITNAVLAHRSCFTDFGGFDENLRRAEDWDMWLRLAYLNHKMDWTSEIVCAYRLHSENMTRDAVSQGKVSIQVLNKFFGNPAIKEEITALKEQAFAAAYLNNSIREYGICAFTDAKEDLDRAIEIKPDLLKKQGEEIIKSLSILFEKTDSPRKLRALFSEIEKNLPEKAKNIKFLWRKTLAEWYTIKAFQANEMKNWVALRNYYFQIFKAYPSKAINRGLLSIFLKSLESMKFR